MTKKDYELVARVLSDLRGKACTGLCGDSNALHTSTLIQVTSALAEAFEEDNPNFNWDIFTRACLPA